MNDKTGAILITGCSSGIGHETARHLAAAGHRVYATARRPEAIADLAEAGCETLACDVTDEASMKACIDAVEEAEGAVYALVNNAGYSQSGAVETVPIDERPPPVRDQRLRAPADVPARPSGHARARQGPDRQRQLDGRQADLPGRRHLSRDQARGRGSLRRDALRGARLRRRRGGHRAGPDQDRLRGRRRGLDGGERRRALRRVQQRGQQGDGRGLRGRAGEARRRPRCGRPQDREGDHRRAPEDPLQGDPLGGAWRSPSAG